MNQHGGAPDAGGAGAGRGSPEPGPVRFDPITLGTEIQRRIGVKTSRDEPLARFTTLRVGGPADLFAVAHNTPALPRQYGRAARWRGKVCGKAWIERA